MLKVAEMATAAVRAGEDKVGLAITLYDAVRRAIPSLSLTLPVLESIAFIICLSLTPAADLTSATNPADSSTKKPRTEPNPPAQVDRHIQRLDADLARYEDSLVIGLRDGTLPSHDAPSAMRKSPPGPTTSLGAIALGEKEAYDDPAAAATSSVRAGAATEEGGRTATGSPRTTRKKPARSAQDLEKEREWKRRKELVREERQRKKRQDLEGNGMPGTFTPARLDMDLLSVSESRSAID